MGTISKMAKKCQVCPDRDKCGHKRMELCAYFDEPKETHANSIRAEISATIGNISGVINITGDNISKEIEKSIKKRCYMNCGW